MADSVDIDLYDNIDEGFDQVAFPDILQSYSKTSEYQFLM